MNVDNVKVCMAVEFDGQAYFVALSQDRLRLLLKMAEGLSDSGRLPVKKAPAGFVLQELPA